MKRWQHSEFIESLVATFVERLGEAIEHEIGLRTQVLATEWLDEALASAPSDQGIIGRPRPEPRSPAAPDSLAGQQLADIESTEATDLPTAAARPRRQRVRTRLGTSTTTRSEAPRAAPPSPEQERRDAEFARLRTLLKPMGQDDEPGAGYTQVAQADVTVAEPPADPLRLLEAEVRSQAHALAQLPQSHCTARIAAWAGRLRWYEETHGNRVAADLFLEKLRVLARAMDAGRIEALNGSWRTRDWPFYIRANEALAEAPLQERPMPAESVPERSGEPDYQDVWSQPS